MATENFKVKKGLEVGTGITATSSGINVTGIITATQLVGDGSGLTGVTGSGSGVIVKHDGSTVGTAGTINFSTNLDVSPIHLGIVTVTASGISTGNVVTDSLVVAGVSTFSGFIDANNGLNVANNIVVGGNVNATQLTAQGNILCNGSQLTFSNDAGGKIRFLDTNNNPDFTLASSQGLFQIYQTDGDPIIKVNSDKHVDINYNLDLAAGLDVIGATNLRNTNIARDLDVDGQTDLDDLVVAGISTFNEGLFIPDTKFLRIGNSVSDPDLLIAHDANSNTVIENKVGALFFKGTGSSGNIIHIQAKNNVSSAIFNPEAAALLHFNGTQKLETTGTGIAVPNISVSGVGTFSTRIDTNGVSFGTNSTTFAAKFADNARAIFGGATQGDFGIYHDTHNSYLHRIPGGTGDIYMVLGGDNAIIAKTDSSVELYWDDAKKLETDTGGVKITGVCTATSFSGDGSGLTGVTASGTGIVVKHDGSTVGTAGTINFSTNLDVSAISAGIVTVTASGGSATTINNNANNRLITGSGTANTLEAESGLTYDGTYFNHIGSGFKQLKIDTSTGNSASLLLKNSTGNFTVNTINNAGNRNFTIYDGTAGETRFNINQGGTVGITSGLNVTGVATATTFSGSGASLTSLPAAQLTGTIAAISGANLTSLNADNLGSGTIPNGRFPATLPTVSGANLTNLPVPTQITVADESSDTSCNVLFSTAATGDLAPKSGTNLTFNSANGTLTATTFSGSGASLTNIPAGNLTGTVADARISTLTASKLSGALPAISGANLTGIAVTVAPVTSYTITADSGSNYYFEHGGVDKTDGNPDLYLVRGQKYRFNNTTGSSHPFAFRVASGGSAYTSGVTGSQNGIQFFTVPLDAPAKIVYQCTIHGGMVGNIYIRGANGNNENVGVTTFTGTIHANETGDAKGIRIHSNGGISATNNELRFNTGQSSGFTFMANSDGSSSNERLRITSDGQIGIGNITPDTWSTGHGLTIGTSQATLWGVGDQINLSGNAYFNSGWKAAASKSGASQIEQALGNIDFKVSGSVTADNAITWIKAVRIAKDGEVGIGTDNPSGKLNLVGSDSQIFNIVQDTGDLTIRLNDRGSSSAYIKIPDNSGALTFETGGDERLRITSGGDLKISTADKGIDFSEQTAASSGSVVSEVMNHFSTGTIGVTLKAGSNTVPLYNNTMRYTRIGNICFVSIWIRVNGSTVGSSYSSSDTLKITGFPFAPAGNNDGRTRMRFNGYAFAGVTDKTWGWLVISDGATTTEFELHWGVPQFSTIVAPNGTNIHNSSSEIYINGHYFV